MEQEGLVSVLVHQLFGHDEKYAATAASFLQHVFDFAVTECSLRSVQLLFSIAEAAGTDFGIRNWKKVVGGALHCAICPTCEDKCEKLKLMLNAGLNPKTYRSELTPLHQAARMGYIDLAEVLLDAGTDINAQTQNSNHSTPIHWACRYGKPEMVKFLIRRGANVQAVAGGEGNTTLDLALCTEDGNYYTIHRYLHGSVRDALESSLWSEYQEPTAEDREEMVRSLVAAGVDINTRPIENLDIDCIMPKLPLHIAAEKHRRATCELLLELGGDPNVRTIRFQRTPLHLTNSSAVIEVLIEAGGDVNARNISGRTPLHSLAEIWPGRREGTKALKMMLAAGCSPHVVDNQGNNPLHVAVLVDKCTRPVIVALLEAGVDGGLRNLDGLTPFDTFIELGLRKSGHSSLQKFWKFIGRDRLLVAINLLPYNPHGWEQIPRGTPNLKDALEVLWEHAPEALPQWSARLNRPLKMQELFKDMRKPMKDVVRAAIRGLYKMLPPGPAPPELRMQVLDMIFSNY